jgi:hypothetical protein
MDSEFPSDSFFGDFCRVITVLPVCPDSLTTMSKPVTTSGLKLLPLFHPTPQCLSLLLPRIFLPRISAWFVFVFFFFFFFFFVFNLVGFLKTI